MQELNNALSQTSSSEEMKQVIEQEITKIKEEKASQTATSSMIIVICKKFA